MPYKSKKEKKQYEMTYIRRSEVKERKRKYARERRDRQQDIYNQIKQIGCYFCGELDYEVLEFAHIEGKENILTTSIGFNTLFKEIKKCEVMCPTCHRKFDLKKLQI